MRFFGTLSAAVLFYFSLVPAATSPLLQPLWKTATGGVIAGDGIVSGGGCTFLSEDKKLYTIGPETGEIHKKLKTAGRIVSGPFLIPGGNVIVEHENNLCGMYNQRGELVAELPLPGKLNGKPAVDRRGISYFATENGNLLSYTHNGRKRWSIRTGKAVYSNPVLTSDENRICVIADGSFVWVSDSGRVQRNSVPYGLRETVRLFSLPDSKLCLLYPDRFLITDETGEVIERTNFPLTFSCIGGAVYTEQFFAFFSAEKTMRFYTVGPGGPKLIFSVNLIAGGLPTGIALYKHYLVLGCSDWILYGYRLPLSLSHTPARRKSGAVPAAPFGGSGADRHILGRYAGSGSRRELKMLVDEIEELAGRKDAAGNDLLFLRLLEEVITRKHGETAGSRELYDELADIRGRAAVLMGKLGNLETQRTLTDFLSKEHHPDVRKALIHALGLLQCDPEGKGIAQVRRISDVNNKVKKDLSLVSEILFFCRAVKKYHGMQVSGDLFTILYEIFSQDYPRNIRKTALELMEMG